MTSRPDDAARADPPLAPVTLVLLLGLTLTRLAVTGEYQRYVRVGMKPWLLAAGLAVLALGITTGIATRRGRRPGSDEPAPHRHGGMQAAWLLVVPVLVLLVFTPPALGSYAVARSVQPSAQAYAYPPLAADGPLPLWELDARAQDRGGSSLRGRTVTLTGFVVSPPPRPDVVTLARFQILCCAADATSSQARLVGLDQAPAANTWLQIRATFTRTDADGVPELRVADAVVIPEPVDPYEPPPR